MMTVEKLIEFYKKELHHATNCQRWHSELSEYYRGRIEALQAVITNLEDVRDAQKEPS